MQSKPFAILLGSFSLLSAAIPLASAATLTKFSFQTNWSQNPSPDVAAYPTYSRDYRLDSVSLRRSHVFRFPVRFGCATSSKTISTTTPGPTRQALSVSRGTS